MVASSTIGTARQDTVLDKYFSAEEELPSELIYRRKTSRDKMSAVMSDEYNLELIEYKKVRQVREVERIDRTTRQPITEIEQKVVIMKTGKVITVHVPAGASVGYFAPESATTAFVSEISFNGQSGQLNVYRNGSLGVRRYGVAASTHL